VRQPYLVTRADGLPLVLAGLWAGWRDPSTDQVRRTFTIVTTTPNHAIADLHDRMPVLLPESSWDRWLPRGAAEPAELLAMLEPTNDVELRIHPVERHVNDVRRDGPELIEPLRALPAGKASGDADTLGL
jgi:putative SOS response-associated peptidase YedK